MSFVYLLYNYICQDLKYNIVKLDPQTRLNVEFKPTKRMKKRRELDALVNNGKASKNGRHELLRNESESSEEVEEFAMPHKSVVRKYVLAFT